MRKERGAVSVEYILITALIAIALIVGWAYLQTQAELNQKSMTDVMSKAAGAAAFDAARAAMVDNLMPTIGVSATGFASKRVGGATVMSHTFSGKTTYADAGVNNRTKTVAPGTFTTAP